PLPTDFQAARARLTGEAPIFIRPLSDDRIAGYAVSRDMYGQPALLLRATLPRAIHQQGERSLRYMVGSLIVVALAFALVMLLLLEEVVLKRIGRLNEGVRRIGRSGDLSLRLSLPGSDELAGLAEAINGTVAAL